MTLRCIFCNRALQQATVMLSGNPVGPDCARKHNLLSPAAKANKRVERVPRPPKSKSERDPHTIDLFGDGSGSIKEPSGSELV